MLELKLNERIQLKKVLLPVADMTDTATLHYKPDGIAFTATNPTCGTCSIIVWIRINSSAVDYFRCDAYSSVGIDPKVLLTILDDAGEEGSAIIRIDDAKDNIYFSFEDNTGESIDAEMVLSEPTDPSLVINAMEHNFTAVVGITAEMFARGLRVVDFSGVPLYVRHDHVAFKLHSRVLVLYEKAYRYLAGRENPPFCTISGIEKMRTFELAFCSEQKTSFLNAALLSDTVWILFPSGPLSVSSFMITCPVEKWASITYFFTRRG